MKIIKYKDLSPNDKIIFKNTSLSFVIKGLALVVSLLTTPAFIKYFNDNIILGVWYTLLSVLTWVLNFDLGIGNGMRNSLVKSLSTGDRNSTKKIISSGMFLMFGISLIMVFLGIFLINIIDLNSFFNISKDVISSHSLKTSVIFIYIAIIFQFFFSSIGSIIYAMQKAVIKGIANLFVSILQLLFVLIAKFDNIEECLVNLSFAYMIFANLPIFIIAIIIFFTSLKDCKPNIKFVEKKYINMVLKVGGIFFVCQILYMLIMNSNEILITKLFSPEFTTDYTFYYKITSIVMMMITLAMTPIWSVVTKAMTENNWLWLKKLFKKIKIIGISVILLEFLMIPFLQLFFNIWLRENAIKVNYLIAISFACFGSVFVYSSMLSTIVCGLGKMKLQAICYSIGILFKFIFVIVLSKFVNDWSIVVWSNAILLFPYCILEQININRIIKQNLKYDNEKSKDDIS